MDQIIIRGARQHNLKNITLTIPRHKLTVVTGLSGSGKSSLVFDTLYAEGQRRYVESLSAYARQFLEMMEKPDVDSIEGLSPAIAIEQRNPSHNPRSTVGTVTEIYDYFRLLFARAGKPHCPQCGKPITPQSASQIIKEVMSWPQNTKIEIMAPLVRGRIGTYQELFSRLARQGYTKVRVNGKIYSLEQNIKLDRYKKHVIDVVVDRIVIASENKERIADSIETALREAKGLALVKKDSPPSPPPSPIGRGEGVREITFSEHYACEVCGISLPELEPRLFSFNSPYGACPECGGLGVKIEVDESLVVTDTSLTIREGAIAAWANPVTTRTHRWKSSWSGYYTEMLEDAARRHRISMDKPWNEITREAQKILLHGDGDFEGVITNLNRRYKETESEYVKEEVHNRFMCRNICPLCQGARLKPEALKVYVGGQSIAQLTALSVKELKSFFVHLKLDSRSELVSRQILKEINNRLDFLINVGLDYVTLDRESSTLAGGEAQRIHLATQIGSGLTGVLYVLDEPTVGLHPRDTYRLLDTLIKLRDIGNTLVLVEHDEQTIKAADWVVDLGPGAGANGGQIIASGTLNEILDNKNSLTAQYLNGKLKIPVPEVRRSPRKNYLEIIGATHFNLKNIDIRIPLGLFVCVTGVSGSGKSTLVYEVLYKALARRLYGAKDSPGKHRSLKGIEFIDKVIEVDQSPIGRTPRSNPSTYTGAFGPIRELFSQAPESRRRGYAPGRFSFNVKGGRCENCQGDGTLKITMQFLPDVYVTCEVCQGARFNQETLEIKYKGKNIAEVLNMSVTEAWDFFSHIPQIYRVLTTINDVGLGYIALGQAATTLSGGEAQRVKLATELCRRATGRTLYILDEPTTGLHFADVEKLLGVLHRLVDTGNTVVVIEHNLDVMKTADWLIDLGPEGGADGGKVIAAGTPEDVLACKESYTGQFLKKYL